MTTRIDVIIPTTGTRTREIEHAIACVHAQVGVSAIPLLVVNGDRFDSSLVAALERRSDVRVHRVDRPGVSNARREGRRHVDAPYFAFLDDDDELLPDAMQIRLAGFADPSVDVVATNGYIETAGVREVAFENFCQHPEDPALAFVKANWLSSHSALFKTDTVTIEYLDFLPEHYEISLLAFRLSLTRKIIRIDVPTFIYRHGASDQLSAMSQHREDVPKIFAEMETMTSRSDLKAFIRAKRAGALHTCSAAAWDEGRIADAWRYHLRSLMVGGGWRYLPYTRRLFSLR